MLRLSLAHGVSAKKIRTFLLANAGTLIEYYDYALYGLFAQLFAEDFFPDQDPTLGLFETFGIFLHSEGIFVNNTCIILTNSVNKENIYVLINTFPPTLLQYLLFNSNPLYLPWIIISFINLYSLYYFEYVRRTQKTIKTWKTSKEPRKAS